MGKAFDVVLTGDHGIRDIEEQDFGVNGEMDQELDLD